MKDTMTPGPAISLATSPDTTYIPVPTQLPTPSDTRSTVDNTRASLVPCELVPDMAESSMDSTGLVLRTRDAKVFHFEAHCTLRGSSFPTRPLILRAKGQGSESKGRNDEECQVLFDTFSFVLLPLCLHVQHCGRGVIAYPNDGGFKRRSDFVLLPLPLLPQLSCPGLMECHLGFSPHG